MRRLPKQHRLRLLLDADTGLLRDRPDTALALVSVLRLEPETAWRERLIAAKALAQADVLPQDRDTIALALGGALHSNYKSFAVIAAQCGGRAIWRMLAWLGGLVVISLLAAFAGGLLASLVYVFIIPLMLCFLAAPLVFLGSPVYDSIRTMDVCIAAAQSLRKLQLPRSVGALAKASCNDGYDGTLARIALDELLPNLTAEHYGNVGSDATPELCALLFFGIPNNVLLEKILDGLEKIGDGRAVEPIQKFMQHDGAASLCEKAERILPILLERQQREHNASSLLRGSSAPPAASRELLRASYPPPTLRRNNCSARRSARTATNKYQPAKISATTTCRPGKVKDCTVCPCP